MDSLGLCGGDDMGINLGSMKDRKEEEEEVLLPVGLLIAWWVQGWQIFRFLVFWLPQSFTQYKKKIKQISVCQRDSFMRTLNARLAEQTPLSFWLPLLSNCGTTAPCWTGEFYTLLQVLCSSAVVFPATGDREGPAGGLLLSSGSGRLSFQRKPETTLSWWPDTGTKQARTRDQR